MDWSIQQQRGKIDMTRFVGGSIIYPQETIVLQGDVQGSEVTDGGGGRKFREQWRHILQHRARILNKLLL